MLAARPALLPLPSLHLPYATLFFFVLYCYLVCGTLVTQSKHVFDFLSLVISRTDDSYISPSRSLHTSVTTMPAITQVPPPLRKGCEMFSKCVVTSSLLHHHCVDTAPSLTSLPPPHPSVKLGCNHSHAHTHANKSHE